MPAIFHFQKLKGVKFPNNSVEHNTKLQKASDTELSLLLFQHTFEQTVKLSAILDIVTLIWRHGNEDNLC